MSESPKFYEGRVDSMKPIIRTMSKFKKVVLFAFAVIGLVLVSSFSSSSEDDGGCHIYGKIKFVEIGEDYKVKFVDIGEDLKIKYVNIGENSVGNWKVVNIGEDYKIKIVGIGEDYKVREVSIGQGCN